MSKELIKAARAALLTIQRFALVDPPHIATLANIAAAAEQGIAALAAAEAQPVRWPAFDAWWEINGIGGRGLYEIAREAWKAAQPAAPAPLTGAWQPIATVPHDTTVLLANYNAKCLLTGAPHVWTATYVTKWAALDGGSVDGKPMWCECSYAATNANGEPTHWMPLPTIHGIENTKP